jgi:hypothetical protein
MPAAGVSHARWRVPNGGINERKILEPSHDKQNASESIPRDSKLQASA